MNRLCQRILFSLGTLVWNSVCQAQVVYSNNFEINTSGFSNATRISLPVDGLGFSSANRSQFLGAFGNDPITLSLSGLTSGQSYSVAFDLFIGKLWDGNSTYAGPDHWGLVTDNGVTLVDTTFLCLFPSDGTINNFTQNYSDTNPIGPGANSAFTGADVLSTNGTYLDRYAIYYFGRGAGNPTLNFTAVNATANLTFKGAGLQAIDDEFWAIDNVQVTGITIPNSRTIGGTVTLEGCNAPEQAITFEFRPKPSGTAFKRKVLLTQKGPDSGMFSLSNIPNGTYDIAIKGFCWLQKVLPNVVVNGNVSGLSASLLTSDINNDNSVDSSDFGLLIGDYGAISDL